MGDSIVKWRPQEVRVLSERILRRSWWARRFAGDVRTLVEDGLSFLPAIQPDEDDLRRWGRHLRRDLGNSVRIARAGNPIAIWVLLNLVLPIVIEIILNWWKNREAHHGS